VPVGPTVIVLKFGQLIQMGRLESPACSWVEEIQDSLQVDRFLRLAKKRGLGKKNRILYGKLHTCTLLSSLYSSTSTAEVYA
jgi:hypothetical protein